MGSAPNDLPSPPFYRRLGADENCEPTWSRASVARGIVCSALALALTFLFFARGAAPSRCVFNVFLARHCDKNPPWAKDPTRMELCTEQGLLRGEHLARAFGPQGQFPAPGRLFARKLIPGVYSSRDLYLLWPLAQRLHLLVNTSFAPDEALDMVNSLKAEREASCLAGSELTVLVSWDHCSIPALAQALGCEDEMCKLCWDDADFDKVLWLRFTALTSDTRWNLTPRAVAEGFAAPKSVAGYRECLGNPAESSNFGFKCHAPEAWRTLPEDRSGLS
ncbi:unnamed protein product [Effrenium voratum]|nr:unnamed protein product [Effrenium voratum]